MGVICFGSSAGFFEDYAELRELGPTHIADNSLFTIDLGKYCRNMVFLSGAMTIVRKI